jgi:hypothetical protein
MNFLYRDRECRNRLVSLPDYSSSKYLQLEDIYEQKKRSQGKLNLPPNSIMKYEKHHMVPIMDIV